jgi:hypothetical protein
MALGTGAVVAGMLLISGISVEGGLAVLVPGLALSGLGLGCASVAGFRLALLAAAAIAAAGHLVALLVVRGAPHR